MDQQHQHLAEARDATPGSHEAHDDGIQVLDDVEDGIRIVPDGIRRRIGPADVLVALVGLAALTVILLLIVF